MHRASVAVLATALLLVSLAIIWKQRQAKSCPAHQRYAGVIALAVAAFCAIAAAVFFYVWTQVGAL